MPYKDREFANARRRTGRPPGTPPRPIADRFWSKVDRRGPDECWPWVGARARDGYGVIGSGRRPKYGGVMLRATQVSWEIANGAPVPVRLQVLHSCDNPPCVNPAHLRIGTQAENMAEMVAKGRARKH